MIGVRSARGREALVAAALAVASLTACSGASRVSPAADTDGVRASPERNSTARTIAIDLVSALLQLPGYDAWSMTVQLTPTQSDFGDALTDAFRDAGYGVQLVDADQGRNYVSYRQRIAEGEGDHEPTSFELAVGGVTLRRDYRHQGDRWTPASLLSLQGVPPTTVTLHDDLFRQSGVTDSFPSGVVFLDESGTAVDTTDTRKSVSESTGARQGERFAEERYLIISRSQIFTRQRSTAPLDERTYRPVSQLVLTFPSADPAVLGTPNKQAVSALLKTFRPGSDRLTLQGCSHGKSLVWDGTESISLERQQRVNQELLVAGVAPDRIREEGCFSTSFEGRLPRQTVILTLGRAGSTL